MNMKAHLVLKSAKMFFLLLHDSPVSLFSIQSQR